MAPPAFSTAVDAFVDDIRSIRAGPLAHPETSLYPAMQTFLNVTLPTLPGSLVATQQPVTAVGAPDFVLSRAFESVGHIEAKAPQKNVDSLHGEDKKQFQRYLLLDNWVLTNFHDFVLFEDGVEVDRAVIGGAPLLAPGSKLTAAPSGVDDLWRLLNRHASHAGSSLTSAPTAAAELARATRLVRIAVEAHLEASRGSKPATPLQELLNEYRKLLISDLSEAGFADAYAQTLGFGLLIARHLTNARVDPRTAHIAIGGVAHDLIGSALQLSAQPATLAAIGWSTDVLARVVNRIDPSKALVRHKGARDPLLYFYEDFLKTYDPDLRRARGAYYTPPEVVQYQVRAVEQLLDRVLGLPATYLDPAVHILDPACGTGTYPLELMQRVEALATASMGPATAGPAVDDLLRRMYGFEFLIGPYTVAHLRLAAAATTRGAKSPPKVEVFLTNTLQEPGAPVFPTFAFMSQPLADERNEADRVKSAKPILAIIGNPPYGRGKREPGTWIDRLMDEYRHDVAPLEAKSLEENYARFIRWACWRLGDHGSQPAILSFITNKSYLTGPAFRGLRRQLRTDFESIFILNLNGNLNRALVAGDENVFDVTVGVAILVAVRSGKPSGLADVWYESWTGTAKDKLARLAAADPGALAWTPVVRSDPTDPLVPAGSVVFEDWPSIDDCFVAKLSGVETTRDQLAVAATPELLRAKIDAFYANPRGSEARKQIFRSSRDSNVDDVVGSAFDNSFVRPLAYRPFDVEYLYDDPDFVTWPRPTLRAIWGEANVALVTVFPIVSGPTVVAVGELPDRHIYLDGAAIFPLHDRQPMATMFGGSNVRPELIDLLTTSYGTPIAPEAAFHWIAAALTAPAFSVQFSDDLEYQRARVPFPGDFKLFTEGVVLGRAIVENQAHGTAYPGGPDLQFTGGAGALGNVEWHMPDTLQLNDYAALEGVRIEEWEYVISRYAVLPKWMAERKGAQLDYAMQQRIAQLVWSVRTQMTLEAKANGVLAATLASPTLRGASIKRPPAKQKAFGSRK